MGNSLEWHAGVVFLLRVCFWPQLMKLYSMPQFRVINSPAFELGVWEMEMEMEMERPPGAS